MAATAALADDAPGRFGNGEREMDEGMRWLTQELRWRETYDAYRRAFDIEEEIVAPDTAPTAPVRIFAPTAAAAMGLIER